MKRQLPKNVRQIGNVSDSSKIYVEDYVDTFFNQLCEKAEQEMVGAFLIGEIVQEEEQDYIYVYGAIRMKELEMKGKEFNIGEHVWRNACETCKEYFGNAEILGWFIAGGEKPLEVNHNISKIHQKYFTREGSLFITKSAREKEEKFYIYKYKNMMESSGHYIYYEKNLEMQNYMIATRKKVGFTPSEIIEDRVAKNFRSIIQERGKKGEQKNNARLIYAMSTFLVLVIVVIGVTMLNNYEKMRGMQNVLNQSGEQDETIETMGGNVTGQKPDEEDEKPNDNPDEKPDGNQGDQPGEDPDKQPEENPDKQPDENPDAPDENTENQPEEYIVQKGDTLEKISRRKYGDPFHIEEICKLNNLENGNLIYIGQKLLLP